VPKPAAPITTAKGNPLTRNPARIVYAAEQLRTSTYSVARTAIMNHFKVHKATAERDIRAAKQLIALELDAFEIRAAETRRNERIADKAEELAGKAAALGEYAEAATLQRTAIAASREVSRLTGAYAPKQVQVTHTGRVEVAVALKVDAILAILDEAGLAAMRVVQEQIEAAKASGRLALPEPEEDEEEVEDAEIVDSGEPTDGEAN